MYTNSSNNNESPVLQNCLRSKSQGQGQRSHLNLTTRSRLDKVAAAASPPDNNTHTAIHGCE